MKLPRLPNLARICYRLRWLNDDGGAAMSWHTQNLSDDQFGRFRRPLWRDGRGWLRTPWATLAFEWKLPSRHTMLRFGLGGHESLWGFALGSPLFALWFHWEPAKWREVRDRSWSLQWHDGALWLNLGGNAWRDGGWLNWHFNPLDFLFGQGQYSKRDLLPTGPEQTIIPTPEGNVPATIMFEECSWVRPRWPWWPLRREGVYADIDLGRGVPVPGKGENSWDIDDDAICAMSVEADNLADAIAAVVRSMVKTRVRHGGSMNWRPREKAGEAR